MDLKQECDRLATIHICDLDSEYKDHAYDDFTAGFMEGVEMKETVKISKKELNDSPLMLAPEGERYAIKELEKLVPGFLSQSVILWLTEINEYLVKNNTRRYIIPHMYLTSREMTVIEFNQSNHVIMSSELIYPIGDVPWPL